MEQQKTDNRFFGWMRAIGVERQGGWIGGVAAGIAAKLGIDPLIVRGILVVAGILGAPVLLVYAFAWLLLPDTADRIHLEDVTRGRFNPAIAGIGVMVIASLLPLRNLLPFDNYFWQNPLQLIGAGVWAFVVVCLAIAFVVGIVFRVQHQGTSTTTVTPDAAPASTTPTEVIPEPAAAVPDIADPDIADPDIDVEPAEPAADAPAAEFEQWRIKQAEWKERNEEYRAQAAAFDSSGDPLPFRMRDQLQTDYEALRRDEAERRARRREHRRLVNPGLGAAWVFVILGVALVAGAIGALVASVDPEFTGSVGFAGVASSAVVMGVAIVIAGAVRRRSGFLSFVAAVLVVLTVPLAFLPSDRQLIMGGNLSDGQYAQLSGSSYIYVYPGMHGTIDLWQGVGELHVQFAAGAGARIEESVLSGTVYSDHLYADDVWGPQAVSPTTTEGSVDMYSQQIGDPSQDLTIRVWQGSGTTWISFDAIEDVPGYTPSPTPTPTPTEDAE